MRYKKVIVEGKLVAHTNEIERALKSHNLSWLLNCEIEDAEIEITNDTLFWNGGIFYWGDWQYGIFNGGEFRSGNWLGGVFLNGSFKNAVWKNGVWKDGTWISGTWQKGVGR